MERASRLIGKLAIPGDAVHADELACRAWPAAVGRKIAARTRAARMVRKNLIVEVEDAIWQRQLFALRGQILANIEKRLGPGIVEEVEFRIVPPRRGPQRAEQSAPAEPADEADLIPDPIMRIIYRQTRRRALA